MADNHDAAEPKVMHERCCWCDDCCEKTRQKLVRHIAHSLGIEPDEADTMAVAARLESAGFSVAREYELVSRIIVERHRRTHDNVKGVLNEFVDLLPDSRVHFLVSMGEAFCDLNVFLEIRDGELIDPGYYRPDGRPAEWPFLPGETPTSDIAF